MDHIFLLIVIIVPVAMGLFLSFFLKNEKQIGKVAPFLLITTLLLNLSVLIYLSLGFQENSITSDASELRVYSVPSMIVLFTMLFLSIVNKTKLIFRLASYVSISFFVGGIIALMLTNFDSIDMALVIFIEIFFMAIIYWLTLTMYRKINPNVKLATQVELPGEKLLSYYMKMIELKLFRRNLQASDKRYAILKEGKEIDVVSQKTAAVRIFKYLLFTVTIAGYYCLAFRSLQ